MERNTRITRIGEPAENDRGGVVVRSNMLINGKFSASLEETKLMILSMYRAQQTDSLEVSFRAQELRGYLKASNTTKLYSSLRDIAVNMTGHHIVIEAPTKKKFEAFAIVPNCAYEDGVFTIKFNESMQKYLFDLSSSYTSTEISILMSFGIGGRGGAKGKSNYALRLYDILRTQKYRIADGQKETVAAFEFEQLKITLGLVNIDDIGVRKSVFDNVAKGTPLPEKAGGHKYARWDNFKTRVLEPALKEINEKTDISVRYALEHVGSSGKIGRIAFIISESDAYKKNAINDRLIEETASIIKEPLGKTALREIIVAADGNMERIKRAYRIACAQEGEIRDLGRWMVSAISGNWEEKQTPVKKEAKKPKHANGRENSRTKRSTYYPEEETDPEEYVPTQLELELLSN